MKHMHTQKGAVGMPVIFIVLGVILLGGIGYAVMKDPMGGEMEKKDVRAEHTDSMMKEADHMMGTDTMMKKDLPAQAGDAMMYKGAVLAGKSAPLLDFNKADYAAAVKSGKLVTLFFYANWCPLCKAEFPKMVETFNGYTGSDVVGFRVNYKDDQTDADEKALAAEFGVSYQHTKVFVKNGAKVLKAPDSWDTARYTSEIAKAVMSH